MEPTNNAATTPALEPLEIEDEDNEQEGNWWKERNLWTRIWQGVAIASFAVNLAAMAIEATAVVIVAGIVAVLIAPVVFYFQLELQDEGTLREVQNHLRQQVNRLQNQNNELANNATNLQNQVSRLKEQETSLEQITNKQGSDVKSFVELVKENQKTLEGLKKCVKADAEQTFVSAVLDSDWDESNTFSDNEIKMLEMRLKNIPGVTVNDEILTARIRATDGSLEAVFHLLSEMDNESIPDEERIFLVDEKHLAKQ